jgi:hypothetical protein
VKEISKENQIQILKNWRDVCNHQKDLERHLLMLARHPESTMEQLQAARDVYRKSYVSLREMEKVLVGLGFRGFSRSVATVTLTEV